MNPTITTASYVLGQPTFTSSGATTTQSGFNGLAGLAYDATNTRLFVSDFGNNRVLVFNVAPSTITNGENVDYVLGQANFISSSAATTQNGLSGPYGLAYDTANTRLFVSDRTNKRVLVFNVSLSTITNGENASYVLGEPNFTSSNATTTQNGTKLPYGLNYDATNTRLFVVDDGSNRVMVFNVAPSTITNGENATNVLGQANFTSSGGATTQNGLNDPLGVAYDQNYNRLFVGEYTSNRVMVFNAATSTITNGENALNVLGQSTFTSRTVAIPPTQSGFDQSLFPDYDSAHNRLFVSDYINNRIMVFTFVTITTTSLPQGVVNIPYSATIAATSSQGTLSFALQSGSLPAGLSLNTSTGVISGTPTSTSTGPFTIEADDTSSTGNFFDRATYTIPLLASQPTVLITTPTNGAAVAGTAPVVATASSNNGAVISSVQFKLDGSNLGSAVTSAPYQISWDTTGTTDGSHILTALATDNLGDATTSTAVSVTVRNTPPVLSNGSPSGTTLSAGTTSAILTLTSDENASCKYDTAPGTSYASMPNTFTTTGGTSQSTDVTGLSGGNKYSYYVRCQDTLGNTDSSDYLITFSVSSGGGGGGGGGGGSNGDFTAPSVPTNLSATAVSSSEIDLSWTASTDNVGVSGYKLYRNGSYFASNPTTSYADTGLTASTSYSYTVSAYDASRNASAQSSPVPATTLGTQQPPKPTDIRYGENILIDHTVYFLDPSGSKRPYTSAGGFLSFGFNSFSSVLTANPDEQNLPTGSFVDPMDGFLINDHGTVYVITSGKRAGFTKAAVFLGLGYKWGNVLQGDTSFMNVLSPIDSTAQAHVAGTLINDHGTVYLLGTTGKLGISSPDVFNSWGYSFGKVVLANAFDHSISQVGVMSPRAEGELSPY